MITASEAQKNVYRYNDAENSRIMEIITKIMENEMAPAIELHSKKGMSYVIFNPYDDSHFPQYWDRFRAQDIFTEILQQYGYKIVTNNIAKNILKISW